MRIHHVLVRGGLLAMLASLTLACNSILGVDEVALAPPDAGVACQVNARFPLVSSSSAPSSLIHAVDGSLMVPSLLLRLNTAPPPDDLFLRLYDNMGGHGVVNAPGSYSLTAADSKLETCGICVYIRVDFNSTTNTYAQTFWARGAGDLKLTKTDSTGLTGIMHNLQFRHVDTTGGTRDAADGCSVTVDTVEFDVPYDATVAPVVSSVAASAQGSRR